MLKSYMSIIHIEDTNSTDLILHDYLISYGYKKKELKRELGIYGFASDQSPRPKPNIYWRRFLGVKVPVFMGAELIARELNFAIVYARVNRIRRGYYEAEFELLTENPRKTKKYEITDIFTTWLEKDI